MRDSLVVGAHGSDWAGVGENGRHTGRGCSRDRVWDGESVRSGAVVAGPYRGVRASQSAGSWDVMDAERLGAITADESKFRITIETWVCQKVRIHGVCDIRVLAGQP